MKRKIPLSRVILLCALMLAASAPAAVAGQRFVEFTVPACQ